MLPSSKNIPKLCFAELAVLVDGCIIIIRVNLNGEIFLRVYQFYQNRQSCTLFMMGTQQLRMLLKNRLQILTAEYSAIYGADAVRIRGALPGLSQRGDV